MRKHRIQSKAKRLGFMWHEWGPDRIELVDVNTGQTHRFGSYKEVLAFLEAPD